MFGPQSRYATVEDAAIALARADGPERIVRYKRRRFVPAADSFSTLVEHRYAAGERLDLITTRYLGEPTSFWQVCDANQILHPGELTDEVGRAIRIALVGL